MLAALRAKMCVVGRCLRREGLQRSLVIVLLSVMLAGVIRHASANAIPGPAVCPFDPYDDSGSSVDAVLSSYIGAYSSFRVLQEFLNAGRALHYFTFSSSTLSRFCPRTQVKKLLMM